MAFAIIRTGDVIKWTEIIGNLAGGMIGAGGALWGVVIGDRRNRRHEERKRQLEATSLALAIGPELKELRGKLDWVKRQFQLAAMQMQHAPMHSVDFSRLRIEVPPVLIDSVERIHILGERAAPPIQQLVAFLRRYNRMLDQAHAGNSATGEELLAWKSVASDNVAILSQHLSTIDTLAGDADREIAPIHDTDLSVLL